MDDITGFFGTSFLPIRWRVPDIWNRDNDKLICRNGAKPNGGKMLRPCKRERSTLIILSFGSPLLKKLFTFKMPGAYCY
jgi:hypothetical protein